MKTYLFIKSWVKLLVLFGFAKKRTHYRPGMLSPITGKFFRMHEGRVIDVSIDMDKGDRFPPAPVQGAVYVCYWEKKTPRD